MCQDAKVKTSLFLFEALVIILLFIFSFPGFRRTRQPRWLTPTVFVGIFKHDALCLLNPSHLLMIASPPLVSFVVYFDFVCARCSLLYARSNGVCSGGEMLACICARLLCCVGFGWERIAVALPLLLCCVCVASVAVLASLGACHTARMAYGAARGGGGYMCAVSHILPYGAARWAVKRTGEHGQDILTHTHTHTHTHTTRTQHTHTPIC